MPRTDFGSSALQKQLSTIKNTNYDINLVKSLSNFSIERVVDVVLDDTFPNFYELGGWSILGWIRTSDNKLVPPFFSNIKQYPLINETVLVVNGVNLNNLQAVDNNSVPSIKFSNNFYISTMNVWNSTHHNAYPFEELINSQQFDNYIRSSEGGASTPPSEPKSIFLGETFEEKSTVRPLQPYEGDVMYEGRWGNSIRFSSTIKPSFIGENTKIPDWSLGVSGSSGDPITIIKNSIPRLDPSDVWAPITENINRDDSSIYLTSTQTIPLEDTFENLFNSYSGSGYAPPININQYDSNQILLSSGRLVFNTSKDHILLKSIKSIDLNGYESVNVDSPKFIVNANNIYLGPEYLATEPLLYGNATVEVLRTLISTLKDLIETLKTAQTSPAYNGPNVPAAPLSLPKVNLKAALVSTTFNSLLNELNYLTSQTNFTI